MIYLVSNLRSEAENSPYRKQEVLDRKAGRPIRVLEEAGGGSTSETEKRGRAGRGEGEGGGRGEGMREGEREEGGRVRGREGK